MTDGPTVERASRSRRSSLLYVLTVVAGNRQLRRVEFAFATFNCGEWASWIAMLVYAYAQGGVTETGIVATVLLVPAAAFSPVIATVGERFPPGKVLLAGYVAQGLSSAVVVVALFEDAHSRNLITFSHRRPARSRFPLQALTSVSSIVARRSPLLGERV